MRDHTLALDESDRQLVLLALAELALSRPGFDWAIRQIVVRIDNVRGGGDDATGELFEAFKATSAAGPVVPAFDGFGRPRPTLLATARSVGDVLHSICEAFDGRDMVDLETYVTRAWAELDTAIRAAGGASPSPSPSPSTLPGPGRD